LQATIPHLTRSALHRCLQRHGISRLSEVEDTKASKRRFKAYPIGYCHIDIAEVRTQEGMFYLFVAIDRTSKFAFTYFPKRLKSLCGLTPYEAICKRWINDPSRFRLDPTHLTSGLNT